MPVPDEVQSSAIAVDIGRSTQAADLHKALDPRYGLLVCGTDARGAMFYSALAQRDLRSSSRLTTAWNFPLGPRGIHSAA